MAHERQNEGSPVPDNVVSLDAYRQNKLRCPIVRRQSLQKHNANFEVEAHLYIDICSDGETRFGVIGADGGNAIGLLEPIFMLGRQLVQLASD